MNFDKIRVLETGYNSAPWNMATDEALLECLGDTPTLRLYGWRPTAVSIGYFQSLEQEVDVTACNKHGIDIVRRITGGGAVFHDLELTYSFLTKSYHKSIMESYKVICDAIIIGLGKIGFSAKFSPINDITINGKKVSGNAQTRKKNVLLQHGTILLDVDLEKMFSVLKVPSEKIRDKAITDARQRITVLNKTFDETASALKVGFDEKFNARLVNDALNQQEQDMAKKLVKEKYATKQWNWKR
jgi:lipoate-protein ligase A